MGIFTTGAGVEMLLRWGHFLSGVAWIGLLYYFNFVQTEYFKEAEAAAKSDAIRKLVPRALWWFRWGAAATLLTGIGIFAVRGGGMAVDIYVGAFIGLLMFTNVWLIIWPNQKIVIASAEQVAGGGAALPEAADALAKAGLASRTNVLFSIPMLFFMGASTHYPHSFKVLALLAALLVVLLVEFNAAYPSLKKFDVVKKVPACEKAGQLGPMASIAGVIHCGLGLTVILFVILELLT
ncbi:MAG: urate hydroxylase PuuD [Gammaproteobacteria bacterium]